jgi:hypothetical protein
MPRSTSSVVEVAPNELLMLKSTLISARALPLHRVKVV